MFNIVLHVLFKIWINVFNVRNHFINKMGSVLKNVFKIIIKILGIMFVLNAAIKTAYNVINKM